MHLDADRCLGALFDLRKERGGIAGVGPDVATINDTSAERLVCGEATLFQEVQAAAGGCCANLRRTRKSAFVKDVREGAKQSQSSALKCAHELQLLIETRQRLLFPALSSCTHY